MKSNKPVIELKDLLSQKLFFFPHSLANDVDGNNHKCIYININGKVHLIPTGVNTHIDQQEFSILRDSGMILPNYTYSVTEEFDPILKPYDI